MVSQNSFAFVINTTQKKEKNTFDFEIQGQVCDRFFTCISESKV